MTAVEAVPNALCRRCETPLESGDLRCAICSLPAPVGHGAHGSAVAVEVLRCDECGAAVGYDVNVRAPRCAFCGSVMHLERSEDPIEEAQGYLPFRVDPATAQSALRRWLSTRGFFRPSDLASAATIHALRPLWWVAWVFDCEALVSWAADSNAGAGRSAWAPHSGQSPMGLRSVLVSASRGLREDEARALAPAFDLRTVQPRPHAFEGAAIERFDVQRSTARAILARAIENAAAAHARAWIPGTTHRNLKVAVLLKRLSTQRLALPSYVLAYRYREKLYRVVVHGQDARCIVGDSPISIWKVLFVVAAVAGALGLALALFLVLLAVGAASS
ncbi:MAG TPA: zinc ribbon domain-containing protein [Sandaracinaceae bacterium]